MAQCPQIEFAGVTKRYGERPHGAGSARPDDSQGRICQLIGPSGCGKSTVLKLISGLTAPSAGAIRVDGMTPKNARETVSLHFSGCDAAALAHRASKTWASAWNWKAQPSQRREEKTAALLKLVGLEHVARRLSARAFRRHEDARFDRARAGHQSEAVADGRAFCRARRNVARPAERRIAAPARRAELDRGVCDALGGGGGFSFHAHRRAGAESGARSRRVPVDLPLPRTAACATRRNSTRWSRRCRTRCGRRSSQ